MIKFYWALELTPANDLSDFSALACVVRKDSNGVTGMEITEEDELRGINKFPVCNIIIQ